MIPTLQSRIERYLSESKHRSLHTLAARAQVSYSTVRRIAQGEVKTVDLSNALAILQATGDWPSTLGFLKEHFPDAGKYLEAVTMKRHLSENIDPNLEASLLEFSKFVIISLAATPFGATRQRIIDVVGKKAGPLLDEMLVGDLLKEEGGKVFTTQENFGTTDLAVQTAQVQHCLAFVSRDHQGKRRQQSGVFTEGVSREGQEKIHAIFEKALLEMHEVSAKDKGDIPIYYGALMGTFLSEADLHA